MKKILIFSISVAFTGLLHAQDFKTEISTAKTSYASGKLEDTHFALQQALQELDIVIGKEVLKLLPAKLDTMSTVAKKDNVTSNVGYIGATIHRSYGLGSLNNATIEIISNSPLIGSINAILNMPMAGMMRDENNKTVKVQGYKARLKKSDNSTGGANFKLEMPFSSSLLTFEATNTTEAAFLALANTLPIAQITKLIQ